MTRSEEGDVNAGATQGKYCDGINKVVAPKGNHGRKDY
jgi:hypothetical protein